jgi:hypothetical protein
MAKGDTALNTRMVKLLRKAFPNGSPKFYEIIIDICSLHNVKNAQYATKSDPLGNFKRVGNLESKLFKDGLSRPLAALLTLMAKQVDGVYEMFGESKKNCPDQLKDKLFDVACYSTLGLVILSEEENAKQGI